MDDQPVAPDVVPAVAPAMAPAVPVIAWTVEEDDADLEDVLLLLVALDPPRHG